MKCSGFSTGLFFFLSRMTRLERLQEQHAKLMDYKNQAIQRNDLSWLLKNQEKIAEIERDIAEAKKYEPMKLIDVLKGESEATKNEVYKSLLRISLLADVVNESCEECKSVLKKLGLNDFSFRHDVQAMTKLSQKIASVVLVPNNITLEDFIVDNAKFVDLCMKHADAYLKKKLKL